jgi:DNA-binding NarL/FixJ family response regulator
VSRILVVDDSAALRASLRELLGAAFPGAAIGEVAGASPALESIARDPWDLVLLDLSLPDRNGVEALREIRRAWPELPVVVMSLHAARDYRAAMLAAGAADYIEKGSPAPAIVDVIRAVLRLS